jgi:hypothetical protein
MQQQVLNSTGDLHLKGPSESERLWDGINKQLQVATQLFDA